MKAITLILPSGFSEFMRRSSDIDRPDDRPIGEAELTAYCAGVLYALCDSYGYHALALEIQALNSPNVGKA